MHKKLESLKPLLKSGDYEKASEALKAYRSEFPDDWDGKLMEGIIAHLRGDEETFHRIHDEAQAVIDGHSEDSITIQNSPLWEKYHSSWKKVANVAVVGLAIAGAIAVSAYFNPAVAYHVKWAWTCITQGKDIANNLYNPRDLYGGPDFETLYDGPVYNEKNNY